MIILPLVDKGKLGFWKRAALTKLSRKRKNGEVKFTENNICVSRNRNTIHYYLNEVSALEVHGDLYLQFNPIDSLFSDHPADRISHTGRTKFFLSFDSKRIEINFLISTKEEFEKLGDIMTKWYQSQQFKIREYSPDSSRMLLLNPYLTYEEIQKVKKKLTIDSMYQ